MRSTFVLAVWVATVAPAHAQRSLAVTDTGTAAPGTTVLELGLTSGPDDAPVLPTVLHVGLAEATELFVGLPTQVPESGDADGAGGTGDLELGVTRRFGRDDRGATYGVILCALLPTSDDEELAGSAPGAGLTWLRSEPVGGGWTVSANYGLSALGRPDESGADFEHFLGVSAAGPLGERLGAFGELVRTIDEAGTDPTSAQVGLEWSASERTLLDASFEAGLDADAPDWCVRFGVTLGFG